MTKKQAWHSVHSDFLIENFTVHRKGTQEHISDVKVKTLQSEKKNNDTKIQEGKQSSRGWAVARSKMCSGSKPAGKKKTTKKTAGEATDHGTKTIWPKASGNRRAGIPGTPTSRGELGRRGRSGEAGKGKRGEWRGLKRQPNQGTRILRTGQNE